MQIPKSIDPDFLKDTIVEIRYGSDLPPGMIAGSVYKVLQDIGYSFKAQTTAKLKVNQIDVTPSHHFIKDNVRVTFNPGTLVFNHHQVYPKWESYLTSIKQVINCVYEENVIRSILRCGLRYINAFKETNIFDIIKPDWRISLDKYQINRSSIKTELFHNGYRVIINVGNDYPSQQEISLIDIDVIKEETQGIQFNELFTILDKAHSIEKELMFVHLLKDEYLKDKNVNY